MEFETKPKSILIIAGSNSEEIRKIVFKVIRLLNKFDIIPVGLQGDSTDKTKLLADVDGSHIKQENLRIDLLPAASLSDTRLQCVLTIGGDGTFLAGAEYAYNQDIPIMGINMGNVGFLTDNEVADLDVLIKAIVQQKYFVQERTTLNIQVKSGETSKTTWALNEASLINCSLNGILKIMLKVDGHRVSSYGCDGMLICTPTGSTAYGFSAGGPIVWPDLDAMIIVPNNAHAIFKEPLVVSSKSKVEIVTSKKGNQAQLVSDGKRIMAVPPGGRLIFTKGEKNIKIAQVKQYPFAETLVKKFNLPVSGWKKN